MIVRNNNEIMKDDKEKKRKTSSSLLSLALSPTKKSVSRGETFVVKMRCE